MDFADTWDRIDCHKFSVAFTLARARALDLAAIPIALGFARHLGGPRTILNYGYRYLGPLGRWLNMRAWLRVELDPGEQTPIIGKDLRNAMAHGVETHLPLLDPAVAVGLDRFLRVWSPC